jgi:hypothetical protein
MIRRRNGMQPGSYNVISRTNLPGRAIQVIFTVDFHADTGPRKGSARAGLLGPGAITGSTSNVPAPLAGQEDATLLASIHSYRQVSSVIALEGAPTSPGFRVTRIEPPYRHGPLINVEKPAQLPSTSI